MTVQAVTAQGRNPQPGTGQDLRALPFDTVILAGGQARRLGGADKPGQLVGARTLAAAVTWAAVEAGSQRIVLVGPQRPELAGLAAALPGGLITDREEPPGSGPLPALRCGLGHVHDEWTAVLAADLPFLRPDVLLALLAAARSGETGAVLADDAGQPQWLAGCWRTAALRSALRDYSGAALRGLLAPLDPVVLRCDPADGQPPPWLDCDTPAELDLARRLGDRQQARAARPGASSSSRPPTEGMPMNTLQAWTEAACAELGLDPSSAPARVVLDLARDVAHQIERPAAPLTAYLLGVAVGRGQQAEEAARRLQELAAAWPEQTASSG